VKRYWLVCSGFGWLLLMGSGGQADRGILAPRGQILGPQQLAVEFENQETEAGAVRYYMAEFGLSDSLEIATLTRQRPGEDPVTMINLQYRHGVVTPLAPSLCLGLWDVQDQEKQGVERSFYLVTEKMVESANLPPGHRLIEYFGYGTKMLNGFFSGLIYQIGDTLEVVIEDNPLTNFTLQGRYRLGEHFQLRAGLFDGDFTFGVRFTTGLGRTKGRRRR